MESDEEASSWGPVLTVSVGAMKAAKGEKQTIATQL